MFYSVGGFHVVQVTTTRGFEFSSPESLPRPFQSTGPTAPRNYDIMPDGRHFVGIVSSGQGQLASPQINVIIEWFTELRQRTESK